MSKMKGRKRNKQTKNRLKRERRRTDRTLRDEHTYTLPANLDTNHVESRESTGLFTKVPCQICEVTNCGKQSPGHGSPIVIDIRSKSRSPAVCAIFFSRTSAYNGTFLVHDAKLNRREIDLNTVIFALQQLHASMLANSEKDVPPAICVNQIIIKTNCLWLVRRFFGGKSHPHRYRELLREFKVAVDELAERYGSRPLVKFWKVKGQTVAQQLVDLNLKRWEESRALLKVQEEWVSHQSIGCIARDLVERMRRFVSEFCLYTQGRDVIFGVELMQWSDYRL